MKRKVVLLVAFAAAALGLSVASGATSYSQGFEVDDFDWTGATRVPTGTNAITSADGNFHAEVQEGAFTKYDDYESTFPSGGYTTSIDIYLDMAENPAVGTDKRFDFTSAISQPDGTHRRDFVFNVGTDPVNPGQFAMSVSNNSAGWPSNPGRDPFFVSESGWYTFRHTFQDAGTGVLEVVMEVLDSNGALLNTWTLSDSTDVIGDTVGGHLYGWFAPNVATVSDFGFIAIDNVNLVSVFVPEDKDDCKGGGWEDFTRSDGSPFSSQGDCIQYVNTGM